MRRYSIGEVAERSGFSASALRYYEGIGLVAPVDRTESGYRVYDDGTLARLAFIDRAKQLGCSLDEISDLVGVWDGERCGPVQRRFHELVTGKLADARQQIDELKAFTLQLQSVAAQLSGVAVDGPCGDDCACLAAVPAVPAGPVIACTLDAESMPDRLSDWDAVLEKARTRTTTPQGGVRIEFDDVDVSALARLVAAEQACCSFFSFTLTIDARGTALEVDAPEEATEVVSALFGRQQQRAAASGTDAQPNVSLSSSTV